MNNTILIVFLVLLFALLVLRLYGACTMKKREGFQGADGKELVIVKANWCGHCKNAMPEFKKLVSSSPIKLQDGSTVVVKILDEKENSGEVEALQVRGFPTILYFNNGQRYEYGGDRSYNGVITFLNSL